MDQWKAIGHGGSIGIEDFVAPAFVELDVGGDAPLVGVVFVSEEVACEPGDLVLFHGNLKFPCAVLFACSIEGCGGQCYCAFFLMQESVEVKEQILLTRLYLTGDHLCGFGDSKASEGIEVTAAAFVLELYLSDVIGDGIGDDEATESRDAIEREVEYLSLIGDRKCSVI